jgi:hypothetical protein
MKPKKPKKKRSFPEGKTIAIFQELLGKRTAYPFVPVPKVQEVLRKALRKQFWRQKQFTNQVASDIAFHMTDWNHDGAFLMALFLFPERFSPEEIRWGLSDFLVHAPNHIVAAAKLHGWPVSDVFGVGALEPESRDD